MTLLIGALGSMGRRYSAILNHLNVPFKGIDINTPKPNWDEFDNFILATPTPTHFRFIQNLSEYKKPILCEKPISSDTREFSILLNMDVSLSMMMQYRYFDRDYAHGVSTYDYYNHGKDGLVWDCFQIISLAKEECFLGEESPIWTCKLNGQQLDLSKMDHAYIWAVREFLDGKYISKDKLLEYHIKVKDYEEKWRKYL